jgi:hypothetical protein
VGTDLNARGIVGGDQVANTHADTVARVAHQTILGFGGNGFAEDVAVPFIVYVDGGTSLNGSCDGQKGWVLGIGVGYNGSITRPDA